MPTDPLHRWIPEPSVEFQIPASLNGDSHVPAQSDYRVAAERLLRVFHAIDEIMIHSHYPHRDWKQISLALNLPSCRYLRLTQAQIGQQFGVSKMCISKSIRKLMRLAQLKPNGRRFNGQI